MLNKNKWEKKGLIFEPNRTLYWSKTHCMIPTPYLLDDGLVKLFYSLLMRSVASHYVESLISIEVSSNSIKSFS